MAAEDLDALALALRPHYSRFLAGFGEDIVLTGHSHQAWPDVSREAHIQAWDDAAALADGKWAHVFEEIIPRFRRHVAKRLGSTRPGDIAVGQNTAELCYRLASCFPVDAPVLTTDGEFHTLRRQLARAEEDGAEITRVQVAPPDDPEARRFGERFVRAMRERRPSWAACSLVFFGTAQVLPGVEEILLAADELDIPLVLDGYHAFNGMELEADRWPGKVFFTAGGYKYAESGEGCCFMLLPQEAEAFRPRYSGWFSDFASLERPSTEVLYGSGGDRFLGSTFDPTPFYRANRVFELMDELGLSPKRLREHSLRQTAQMISAFDRLALDQLGFRLETPREPERRGGFIALAHPRAEEICARLRARGVRADRRGNALRFGPSPFTTAAELSHAMEALRDAA